MVSNTIKWLSSHCPACIFQSCVSLRQLHCTLTVMCFFPPCSELIPNSQFLVQFLVFSCFQFCFCICSKLFSEKQSSCIYVQKKNHIKEKLTEPNIFENEVVVQLFNCKIRYYVHLRLHEFIYLFYFELCCSQSELFRKSLETGCLPPGQA